MRIFRHRKAYYFEKMRHGLITDNEVASIFNVSTVSVRIGFVEYAKRKNPFLRQKRNIFPVIEIITSLLAFVISFLTLQEMQTERDNAYLPDLYFQSVVAGVSWDSSGPCYSASFDEASSQILTNLQISYIDEPPVLKIANMGIGKAKNIEIDWLHRQNVDALLNYLYSINDESEFTLVETDIGFHMKSKTVNYITSEPGQQRILYLLNDDETDFMSLPREYWECIRQIFYESYNHNSGYVALNIPNLILSISYTDVQGKQYKYKREIQIEMFPGVIMPLESQDGGLALFILSEK